MGSLRAVVPDNTPPIGFVKLDGSTPLTANWPAGSFNIRLNNNAKFEVGTSGNGALYYDSIANATVVEPNAVATSYVSIGAPVLAGGTADLVCKKLALMGAAISGNVLLNCVFTGNARSALTFTFVCQTPASTLAAIQNACTDAGTGVSMTAIGSNNTLQLNTAAHVNSVIHSGVVGNIGINAGIVDGTAVYTGYALRALASGQGVGNAATTTGVYVRYGLLVDSIVAIAGTPVSDTIFGAFINNSLNLPINTPLIFDSALGAGGLGDTSIKYVSASTDLQVDVDGVAAFIFDDDKNISKLDFKLDVVGTGIYLKEGTDGVMGIATMVGGVIVVNTTKVTANSRIQLTPQNTSGGAGSIYVSARTPGTSFTITSTNILDTRDVAWVIFEPA